MASVKTGANAGAADSVAKGNQVAPGSVENQSDQAQANKDGQAVPDNL